MTEFILKEYEKTPLAQLLMKNFPDCINKKGNRPVWDKIDKKIGCNVGTIRRCLVEQEISSLYLLKIKKHMLFSEDFKELLTYKKMTKAELKKLLKKA